MSALGGLTSPRRRSWTSSLNVRSRPALCDTISRKPVTRSVRTDLARPHHPLHHGPHPLAYETGDFLGVGADGLSEGWIVGCFLSDHTSGRQGQLAAVTTGVAEESRQALAHACHLRSLIEMGVHARNVGLELGHKVRSRRFGNGAHASGDFLDTPSELAMPVEHLHVAAHVHGTGVAHHPRSHHAAVVIAGITSGKRSKDPAYDISHAWDGGYRAEHNASAERGKCRSSGQPNRPGHNYIIGPLSCRATESNGEISGSNVHTRYARAAQWPRPSPSGPKGPKSHLPPWYLSGETPCSEPYHRYLARGFQKRPETGRSTSFRAQVPPEVLPSPSSGTAARYRHAEPRACLTRLAWLRISAGLYEIVCTPG